MSIKPSTIESVTTTTGPLDSREIIAVRIDGTDGTEAWYHGTVRKDGGINTKSITLPSITADGTPIEYQVVRESVLFTLAEEPEWLDNKHICRHDHREHGQAGSWAFARLNRPGSPHDCQVCYGTVKQAEHCHTVSARDGLTCGQRKAGWVANAKAEADRKAKEAEDKAKADAEAAAATPVEAPVDAPKRTRGRKAAQEPVAV
jgi:hypothetical protein